MRRETAGSPSKTWVSISSTSFSMPATTAPAPATSSGMSGMSMPAGSAGSSAEDSGQPVSAPKITIKNFGFSGNLTVRPGQKVTVSNEDGTPHTLTDKATHKFDTGNIDGNGSGTFTAPTKPGTYPFGCNYHPEMHGTLVVKG